MDELDFTNSILVSITLKTLKDFNFLPTMSFLNYVQLYIYIYIYIYILILLTQLNPIVKEYCNLTYTLSSVSNLYIFKSTLPIIITN